MHTLQAEKEMASSTAMEVIQVISTELIKPTATTPSTQTLKSFKLGASLDENHPLTCASLSSLYVPLALFYPAKPRALFSIGLERAEALKQSLGQCLTRFYPLAGKIRLGFRDEDDGVVFVDCDDSGVLWVEATVKCPMSRFLKRPDFSVMEGFLPVEGFHVAKIQVNIFECGGIAVSVLISQFVVGLVSLSGFLKDWAGATKGFCCRNGQALRADFSSDELNLMQQKLFKKGKAVTRRLIFDSEAIASLKAITMSSMVQNPTAIEAVSSLIWKCTMDSLRTKLAAEPKSCALLLSTRTQRMVTALCGSQSRTDLDGLVLRLRGAITKGANRFLESESDDLEYLVCYGWCTSGLYGVDFGWGRPAWVTSIGNISDQHQSVFLNSVVMVETRWGDGMEAWVTLDEKIMADVVHNQELLTFASTIS